MNPLILIPAKYKALVIGFALLAAVIGLLWTGHHYGAQGVQADWDKEKREAAEATLSTEREIRRAFDSVAMNSRKEKERAKATIDSLRADVRSGAERLSVAVESCQTGDSGSGTTEARADILPASADRIIQIIGEADDAVRELNECIDKYNAVRNAK